MTMTDEHMAEREDDETLAGTNSQSNDSNELNESNENDENDESTEIAPAQLGFVVPVSAVALPALATDIDDFPNKVGGRPVWLDPSNPLPASDTECPVCMLPMSLLTQLYTPEDKHPQAFHRLVLLFACMRGTCHKKGNAVSFRLFRTQLPQENSVYSPEGILRAKPVLEDAFCRICGLKGSLQCSQCKCVRYCSKAHATLDWTTGGHKSLCQSPDGTNGPAGKDSAALLMRIRSTALFPEFELESENEPNASPAQPQDLDVESTQKLVDSFKDIQVEPAGEEEAPVDSKVDVDGAFLRFQHKMALAPEQVIRYCRVDAPDDVSMPGPLFANDDVLDPASIPACPNCGIERTFEFQVMPQLLNHLGVNHLEPDALDWGTILAYTCPENCQPDGLRYIAEHVVVQTFSQSGMGDSIRKALQQRKE